MTAYSLLERPLQKGFSRRQWQTIIVMIGVMFVPTHHSVHNETTASMPPPFTPPQRSINFTINNSVYYVDLDKYSIEDHLLQVFGGPVFNSIQQITMDRLENVTQSPWADKWLSQAEKLDDINAYACSQQPLPYPILRRMAREYFPVQNNDDFYNIDDALNLTAPFVIFPSAKQRVFQPGQQLCIRVVVPFQNVGKNDLYRSIYRPYDHNHQQITSPWWDTMMTVLTNTKTNATVPIHMQPWFGHRLLRQRARDLNHVNNQLPEWARLRGDVMYERERMHIYEAQITLPERGKWVFSGLLEFVEGRYNFEFGPVTPYHPIVLPVLPAGSEKVHISTKEKSDKEYFEEHLALPLCIGFSHPGRWLPMPNNTTETQKAQVAGVLRNNKYWAPFRCRYRHISYEAFNRCASKKYARGMDLYGDSNIRRSIKKFLSHGQWCKDWEQHINTPLLPENMKPIIGHQVVKRDVPPPPPPPPPFSLFPPPPVPDQGRYNSPEEYKFTKDSQTRSCYCEDFSEEYWNTTWFDPMARHFNMSYANSLAQTQAVGRTEWDAINDTLPEKDVFRVSSYKWDGLTYLNSPGWDTAVPTTTIPADIAIFSLGNWDGAFSELDAFSLDLDRLIQQIKDHYDLNKTKIIYRTAQYYCCRIDASERSRQVSGPRMDSFDSLARLKFITQLKADIWDTYALGESKTWEEKITSITCPSNHVPADQVEIENQLLMNGLCNGK
ncbi:uncharacterized protein B0P05DRAFT_468300 [Gilbertella persicaria]|uniref:uncharacterized protein n=1 Tax=Gilbertella persicaria TaxID=101096 RepID=UPI00221FF6B6|nr:uncharacterized protein B0P05DRAFT_468300 [Gilbertella persicaria]KAI8082483.1 hypothetical protein B0P05DRAFT_468300 [Gilbertella persicaria]